MPKDFEKTPVKGGVITREARTGRLVSVETDRGVSKVARGTRSAFAEIGEKRRAALERLKDR